jgi:hypothetical protein
MAVTKTTYTQSGNTTQYNVPFEVIAAADIDVYINGVLQLQQNSTSSAAADHPQVVSGEITQGTALTNYTVASNNATITFNAAPAASAFIIVERTTDSTGLATFVNGSTIRAADLNESFERVLFIAEEGTNVAGEALVASDDEDDAFDAKNDKIINLANGTDDDDAVNRAQLGKVITDDLIGGNGVTLTDASGGANSGKQTTISVPDGTTSVKGLVKLSSTTPITTTYNSAGDVTLSIADDTVDFDKIKNADKIKLADQEGDYDLSGSDDKVFTSVAAIRRFENYVQNSAPSTTGIGKGAVWLDVDDDKTLSVWDGSAWQAVTSGGTFSNQPKVVYVDASSGSDSNDGHRISRPKATIKAAITQINADSTHGDGSIVVVAPGVYQEACPIQIQKRDVAIVGTSVRNCVVHPTPATETATMFEVNSGSYLKNLTFTGMKASGTRGASGSLWENSTHGLPPTQGWNVAFFNNAMIYKSPYVQNCTNFSDSEIDNSNLNFYAGDENKGRAGDLDSAPTGGGLLIDGSTPHADSPLRSIVCDSYTHTGLDAPGIFVTNNGYCQATSSYAFFNHAHITCINGGQANLAASTTDFGRFGLIASGKSTSAIFTSTIDGAVSDGAISFNIDAPTAASGWHGSATRPQSNMLVTVNSVTYPILSATANGSGWTVTISRPNSSNRSQNLGVNGAISDGAAVSFFLRSMIASSGHTMEYVGSGTDYRALPGNGGVPVDANQKVELDNGKIWTATTDQNGKFTIGGNQTDDPFFEVDQQLGFVTIPEGSIAFNLLSDLTPQLGGDLDVNGKKIVSVSNGDIEIEPNGTGNIVLDGKVGVGISSPDGKLTLPATASNTPALRLQSASSNTDGALSSFADASGTYIALGSNYHLNSSGNGAVFDTNDKSAAILFDGRGSGSLQFLTGSTGVASERVRINSSGNVGIATTDPKDALHVSGNIRAAADAGGRLILEDANQGDSSTPFYLFASDGGDLTFTSADRNASGGTTGSSEKMRIDSDGKLLVGLSSSVDSSKVQINFSATLNRGSNATGFGNNIGVLKFADARANSIYGEIRCLADGTPGTDDYPGSLTFSTTADAASTTTERMRINSSGNVGIGTTNPGSKLQIVDTMQATANGHSQLSIIGDDSGTNGESARIFLSAINATNRGCGIVSERQSSSNDHDLIFQTSPAGGVPAERMRIDSSGNVGIGTTSPGDQLHIHTASSGAANVRFSSNDVSSGFFVGFDGSERAQIWHTADAPIRFATHNNERMQIDGDGRLLINHTADTAPNGYISKLQLCDTSYPGSSLSIRRDGATSSGPVLLFAKSRSTSKGGNTVIQNNDSIGSLYWYAADGTDADTLSGEIAVQVDGTPGSNNIPTRMVFATNSGASDRTERMRIDSSGRVFIGTTNVIGGGTEAKLHLVSGGGAEILLARNDSSVTNGNSLGGIRFYGNDGGSYQECARIIARADGTHQNNDKSTRLEFLTTTGGDSSPTERMRITNEGLQINVSESHGIESQTTLASTGSKYLFRASNSSGSNIVFNVWANGTTENLTGTFGTISDRKLKENIVDAGSQWDDVKAFQFRKYNFTEESGYDTHTQLGVIAQEIETVSPGLIYEVPDTDIDGNDLETVTKRVKTSILYMKAMKALQEAMDRIETLEAKVAALEAG